MDDGDEDDPIMRLLDREISGSVSVQVSQQHIGQQQNNIVHVENAVFAAQVNPPAAEVLQAAAGLAHMAEVAARDRESRAAEMAGTLTKAEAERRHKEVIDQQEQRMKDCITRCS